MGAGDSVFGSDGGENVFQTGVRPDADAGSGADAGELVTHTVTDADAGSGAESQSVSTVSGGTTGKGDGSRSPVAVYDTAGNPPWNLAETGHGSDGGESIVTGLTAKSDADAGFGVDGKGISRSGTDSGSGHDGK